MRLEVGSEPQVEVGAGDDHVSGPQGSSAQVQVVAHRHPHRGSHGPGVVHRRTFGAHQVDPVLGVHTHHHRADHPPGGQVGVQVVVGERSVLQVEPAVRLGGDPFPPERQDGGAVICRQAGADQGLHRGPVSQPPHSTSVQVGVGFLDQVREHQVDHPAQGGFLGPGMEPEAELGRSELQRLGWGHGTQTKQTHGQETGDGTEQGHGVLQRGLVPGIGTGDGNRLAFLSQQYYDDNKKMTENKAYFDLEANQQEST